MPSLFVYQGHDQGSLFDLEEGTLGLGRDTANHIQVHDTEVSRRHAEISYDGIDCIVTDLNSSNGTYVNGKRIVEACKLASGDKLQVGGTTMLFTDPGENVPDDLSDKIDIVTRGQGAERSRIVRSMSQEEGSETVSVRARGRQQPLARAGPQQSADHVSHGLGREPHARHRPAAQSNHAVDFRMGRGRPRLHHADRRTNQAIGAQGAAQSPGLCSPARSWRSARRFWITSCSTTKGC